jgi:hypothetical protein
MYWALNDELLLAYTRGPLNSMGLSAGVWRSASGFHQCYDFYLLAPAPHLRPGQLVQGVFGAVGLTCAIVEVEGLAICLAIPRYFGARIDAGAEILTDTSFITEALLRRLTAGIRGFTLGEPCCPPFNGAAALRIIAARTIASRQRLPHPDVFRGGRKLNDEQRRAIRLAFGSDAHFLFGPPGTGKTTTLARVVEAHVLAGRSVLLLGPTNRAVDILMRAVAHRLQQHQPYHRGQVLRFGARPDQGLLGAHAAQVCLEQVVDRIRSQRYAPGIVRLERRSMACLAEECSIADHLRPAAGNQGPTLGSSQIATLRRRLSRVTQRRHHFDLQRRRIQRTSALLPRRLVAQCEVLGTTIHQTYLSPAIRRQFDVVVIDEGSMVPAVQVYVAAGLAKGPHGRVIVAGDYRQLPPIAHAKTDRAFAWLRTDIFHAVGIPDDLASNVVPSCLSVLDEQHRMAPGICAVVSRLFYGDRLKPSLSVRNRVALPSPLGAGGIFVIDSSPAGPIVQRTHRSSRVNKVHVRIIEDLLAELDSGSAMTGTGPLKVAVFSPFRGQAGALRKRLGDRYQGRDVAVSTTHSGQGDEADIVILDLTDAPGLPISGFLNANDSSEVGARLLNVAMSRARHQLYIVGAMDYLESAGGHVVRVMIDDLRVYAEHVQLAHFRGSADQVYGPKPKRVAKPTRNTQRPRLSPRAGRKRGHRVILAQ